VYIPGLVIKERCTFLIKPKLDTGYLFTGNCFKAGKKQNTLTKLLVIYTNEILLED